MRAFHDTRQSAYRAPYGAVPVGTAVRVALDVWDDPCASCVCRLWIDGAGESLLPMERTEQEGRLRFFCDIPAETADIIWYSFLIYRSDGGVSRYGAAENRVGGEGRLYDHEPPSFQLTVYVPRPLPEWYRKAIVYQIFPDRFRRGPGWEELTEAALSRPRNGPGKRLVEDWNSTPVYDKTPEGRVRVWDFYGGTLSGIEEKLDYLKQMGVTALYLNPVFEAASSHRYDIGDHTKIDPMLGDEEAFRRLCEAASEKGISVILDGVFNHTGCDSLYFNKYGNYPGPGAWQSEASPYRSWYRFDDSPIGYDCWWGVDDLPCVEENDGSYRDFIFGDDNSVVRRWLKAGARGWRLDVADELPDDFIEGVKSAVVDALGEEGLLLGEVWEDASHKISYGKLRRYLLGTELDSVMNYPFLDAAKGFLTGGLGAGDFAELLEELKENYPPSALCGALDLIGSHDRPRIMTILGGAPDKASLTEEERRDYRLSPEQRALAKSRMWLIVLLQMTMPGVPCIYYGDEAGLEGYDDPYNRGAYPWGSEDEDLKTIYRNAIGLRKLDPVFTDGSFTPFSQEPDVFGFYRETDRTRVAVLINRSLSEERSVAIHAKGKRAAELISGGLVELKYGEARLSLPPLGSALISFHDPGDGLAAPMPEGTGILCHITSLPNEDGPGNIGRPALEFIDMLARAGQRYWQILPIHPTDEHGSPYAGASAFAANIALLPESGEELRALYRSFEGGEEYEAFCRENGHWLTPYALFMGLKKLNGNEPWYRWPEQYRNYAPEVITDPEVLDEAGFQRFCQFRFHETWRKVREAAAQAGVSIIGDMPMYVSLDSADVWAYRDLFTVGEDGRKTHCAGVPPDAFSDEGQHWGNPLYRWERMKEDGYEWWMRRFARAFDLYDYVRLDHFRGFESYWSIPEGEKPPAGQWIPGPGTELFRKAYERFGPLRVIAEDLGYATPAVRGLLDACGFSGTDVVQFYEGDPLNEYRPESGKIAYSGTHDNRTLVGWCGERYPDIPAREAADRVLKNVLSSEAAVKIVPLQDVLGLDDEARMNTPGTVGTNWRWQARKEQLPEALERLIEYSTSL